MRPGINLASEPFVNRTPQALLLGALLAGAVGLTAWNVATVARSASEARAVEGQLRTLAEEEDALRRRGADLRQRLQAVDVKPLQVRAAAANEVLAQKALSWSLLLERLEEILPWQAALDSVHANIGPDGVKLTLHVHGRSQEEILDLLDALEESPCFAEAYPSDEGRRPDGEFEAAIEVEHDPYCGNAPQVPGGVTMRGSVARRGGRRG